MNFQRIGVVGGAVAAVLGIFVTLHTQGWTPVLRAEFQPFAESVQCEVCLRQCQTVFCPECSPMQCWERCRASGECR